MVPPKAICWSICPVTPDSKTFGVGGLDEPGHGAVRDPYPADEGDADEVAQVPGPFMFQSLHQWLVPGRHVEFYDEQGDGDREDAVGEGLQAGGGQEAVVIA
jgi:hypothetical protein